MTYVTSLAFRSTFYHLMLCHEFLFNFYCMKIKLYVIVGIVKRKNPKQYPFLLGFVALQLWRRTSQQPMSIYSDSKLIDSLL